IVDTSQTASKGLNVTSDLNAISNSATSITFRVWENGASNGNPGGNPSDALHRQLTDSPTLEVQWIDKPSLPYDLEESANSDGSTDPVDCSTNSSNPPHIGKTDSL